MCIVDFPDNFLRDDFLRFIVVKKQRNDIENLCRDPACSAWWDHEP